MSPMRYNLFELFNYFFKSQNYFLVISNNYIKMATRPKIPGKIYTYWAVS